MFEVVMGTMIVMLNVFYPIVTLMVAQASLAPASPSEQDLPQPLISLSVGDGYSSETTLIDGDGIVWKEGDYDDG